MGVVDTALKYIGVPYVWGGSSPSGFDCSGLVQYSYAQNGISIPRVAQDQYNKSTKISKSELQKGDLIFTSKLGSTSKINHVVMYIGDNKVIEAPYTGMNVRTKSLDSVSNIVGYGTYNASSVDTTTPTQTNTETQIPSMEHTKWYDVKGKLKVVVFNIFKFIIIALLIVLFVVFITKALDISIF